MKQTTPDENAIRQKRGFTFAATGAVLGFVSCVLSQTNPVPELYHIISHLSFFYIESLQDCILFLNNVPGKTVQNLITNKSIL